MVLSAVLFSVMGPIVRFVPAIPAMEILMFRSVVAVGICVAWLHWLGKPMFGRSVKWLVVRGVLGFLGLSIYVYAIQHMPLAEAVVIQYTNPIFTALFAPFILKEKWRGYEWIATLAAFGGVLLIAGAGGGSHPWIALLSLGGAISVGLAYNVVRKLGLQGEDPLTIVLSLPVATLVLGVPLTIPQWKTPTLSELGLLLLLGVTSSFAQIELTKGLKLERAAKATVVNYLIIALAVVYGLGFGEIPSSRSFAGMALIFGSLLLVSRPQPALIE